MESRMDPVYIIHNKSYHDGLLKKLFNGVNPLAGKMMDAIAIYCPDDAAETQILDSCQGVCLGNNGRVAAPYEGRATILY